MDEIHSESSADSYDSSVPISLQMNFCAASMMRSFSQASFDSLRCWSSFFRIYISLCSHGSSVTSSIISDCWKRFTFWIFCLCFQNARSIINQLCFRHAINNQAERQSSFPITQCIQLRHCKNQRILIISSHALLFCWLVLADFGKYFLKD